MSQNNLSEWARRLEARLSMDTRSTAWLPASQDNDAELDLAASLQASPPPTPAMSPEFVTKLGQHLAHTAARQSSAQPRLDYGWLSAGIVIAFAALIIFLAIRVLPNSPIGTNPTQPSAVQLVNPTPSLQEANTTPRLVYSCGSGSICTALPDGSDPATLLTLPGQHITPLSISPDGRYLLLSASPNLALMPTLDATPDIPGVGRLGGLYTINLETSALTQLAERYTGGGLATWSTAYWLPDGQILFINEDEQLQTAIYRIQPDGSGLSRLTSLEPSPTHWQLLPTAPPERVYWREGKVEGYTVSTGYYWWSPVSGEQTQELAWPSMESSGLGEVRFAPNGEKIAYVVHRDRLAVYIANADGSQPRLVWSPESGDQATPGLAPNFYWSPEGRSLLLELYQMNSDPAAAVVTYALYDVESGQISPLPEILNIQEDVAASGSWRIGLAPQWSPDGKSVLLNHPDYANPKLLDLETLKVTEALASVVQPGDLSSQPVLWLP